MKAAETMTSGFDVFAYEMVMHADDGDIHETLADNDGESEIVAQDCATLDEAVAAAKAWMLKHPALWNHTVDPFNPLTLTHHVVEATRWEVDPDYDERVYDNPSWTGDTETKEHRERVCKVLNGWDEFDEEEDW